MNLTYTVTQSDVIAYYHDYDDHDPAIKKRITTLRLAIGLVLVFVVVVAAILVFSSLVDGALFALAVAVGGGVGIFRLPYFFRQEREKQVKALFANGGGKEFVGPRTLTFNESDLCLAEADKTTTICYGKIEQITEDEGRVYVYVGSVAAIIVPKTAFAGPVEQEAFFEELVEKCEKKTNPQ